MSTFVLIHGAAHGGWCWYKVKNILEEKGHRVVAPNLSGHDAQTAIHPEEITFERYVTCVQDILAETDGEVILVGHSMGGAVITKVCDTVPQGRIQKVFYVSGLIPEDGDTIGNLLNTDTGSQLKACFEFCQNKLLVRLFPDTIGEVIYNGCSDEAIEYAKANVVYQSVIPFSTPIRLHNSLSVPRVGIVCTMDRSLTPGMQETMYKKAACEIRYLDSGHAPFFSRPEELAAMLLEE